jgi:hypothetical protein
MVKSFLGGIFGSETVFRVTDSWLNRSKMPYVRGINYHDTPKAFESNFRKHLEWYSSHFVNCSYQQLRNLISAGTWNGDMPGILISFDDGLKSNYNIAALLLEQFGFTGWFMVPVTAVRLNHE